MKTKCEICGKEVQERGLKGHVWRAHGAGQKHNPRKGVQPWNVGLSKDTDSRVAAYADQLRSLDRSHRVVDPEKEKKRRQHLSTVAKERGLGGHTSKQKIYFRRNNGTVVYLQSSYELHFAEILENLGIDWERPAPLMWVDDDGGTHRYYADFKVGEVYIDTKNDYLAVKDLPKIEKVRQQNAVDVRIVTRDLITEDYIATFV